VDPAAFRAEFPVLQRLAYLNAGTDGPVPQRAALAAQAQTGQEVDAGRSGAARWESLARMKADLRGLLSAPFECRPDELAITHSTTDGMNTVISGLPLGRGDEVLTSDEEHPGLLAPLEAARRRSGFSVRVVPFAELAGEVGAQTKLVACSHVSWVGGDVVDVNALRSSGAPVLLDGAQGLGAVETKVSDLGCHFYAAAGQKWLCGPDGSGCLYVRADQVKGLSVPWPGYESLADPGKAQELPLHEGARRFDLGPLSGPQSAWWLASIGLLAEAGWDWVLSRGPDLAERLAERLRERGLEVAPRGRSTLVSWASADAEGDVTRLQAEGIVVRDLPGRGLVRASVGAWSSEEELDRLAGLAV